MSNSAPADFVTALESLKGQHFRPELRITQIPGPTHIAPWTVALQLEAFATPTATPNQARGDAKFVVLHDPAGQAAWNGTFRIVINARAPMDLEMGNDPLLGEVAWSWLGDSLGATGATYHSLNGTVTRVFNESFGGSELSKQRVNLELRASWTPQTPHLTEHLLGWAQFTATLAGLGPEGVATLPRWRNFDS